MPVTTSAKKALRSSKSKAIQNAKVRDLYKQAVKEAKNKPTVEKLSRAFSILDKAAKVNVIHTNKAARLKSRLAKLLAKLAPESKKDPGQARMTKTDKVEKVEKVETPKAAKEAKPKTTRKTATKKTAAAK